MVCYATYPSHSRVAVVPLKHANNDGIGRVARSILVHLCKDIYYKGTREQKRVMTMYEAIHIYSVVWNEDSST